jgi:internalin A
MDAPKQPVSGNVEGVAPRRAACRWFQFRLRTLLILVALCAVAAFAFRTVFDALPYRQPRRTAALIEQLGGSYQTAQASSWHRRLFGSDLQNLVLVNLADCDVPDRYIDAVADLPQLETLAVGGEAFTDRHLSRLRGNASLRYLVLDGAGVSDEAVAALRTEHPQVEVYFSERRAMAALHKLAYMSCRKADVPSTLRTRVGEEFFQTCHTACFSGKTTADRLLNLRHLRHVATLRLPGAMNDELMAGLSRLSDLQELMLAQSQVTDAGLAHLEGLPKLHRLALQQARVGDAGLAHLKSLHSLKELDLTGTKISDKCVVHLKGLTQLKELTLEDTAVTKAAVKELRKALPACHVSDAAGALE